MNETNNMREITLRELWNLFIRRIIVIVLVAAMAVGGIFALDQVFYKPQYTSTATLYILLRGEDDQISIGEATNELSLALRLVYDCNYFLKSRSVLNTVIEDLDLDMTYDKLRDRITTTNPTNTRILEISVRGDTPEQAKAIVDQICAIGADEVAEAVGFSQLHLYENGNLPDLPSNSPSIMKYIVVGIAAAAIAYAIFLLMYILDDRIRSDEEIEKLLGLSILAEIPNTGAGGIGRYGYYMGGKRSYTPGGQLKRGKKNAHGAEKRS